MRKLTRYMLAVGALVLTSAAAVSAAETVVKTVCSCCPSCGCC